MIYLDSNATTFISKSVLKKMQSIYEIGYVNPSSVHQSGMAARNLYQNAKEDILSAINAEGYDLIFTSSGTEANNLALSFWRDPSLFQGKTIYKEQKLQAIQNGKVIMSEAEHESIKNQPVKKAAISVDNGGIINIDEFRELSQMNSIASIMWANNQTGVVQNINELLNVKGTCLLHTDAVQYAGKRLIDLGQNPVDAISISGHKIHGPHGVGCLIFKKNFPITSIVYGGSQEGNFRAGTHNLPAIVGFAQALKEVNSSEYIIRYCNHTQRLKDFIIDFVQNNGGEIVGLNSDCLSNTLCIIKKDVLTTEQLLMMDVNNICVSAGSACSAGVVGKSYVLQSMGFSEDKLSCMIRVSLDVSNTMQEVEKFCKVWKSL